MEDRKQINNIYRQKIKENRNYIKNRFYADCCGISIQTLNNWMADTERYLSPIAIIKLKVIFKVIEGLKDATNRVTEDI